MTEIVTLAVFVAVFLTAELRKAHIGILMFSAACGMGLLVTGLALEDIIEGFPIDIMILLVGVTYFFGIAKANGTIERLIGPVLAKVGDRNGLLPATFFLLTAVISAMGAPLGGLVMAPIGMSVAHRRGIDPMLMGIAIGSGLAAGGFAPTSLFGIVAAETAASADIPLNPVVLFAVSIGANLVLLTVAYLLFGSHRRSTVDTTVSVGGGSGTSGYAGEQDDGELAESQPFSGIHRLTMFAIVALIGTVIVLAVLGNEPDVGVLAFAFASVLALIDPGSARGALKEIDWSTVLLVGGIITYVSVLQELGAVDRLGDVAASVGLPLLSALVICAVCGLVSAFASTTGILAALVPLAIPLVQEAGIPGWALICALSVCSSIVDVSPFSTVGATLVATTEDPDQRPRMTAILARWGLSMVVIGPVALVGVLVLPAMAT